MSTDSHYFHCRGEWGCTQICGVVRFSMLKGTGFGRELSLPAEIFFSSLVCKTEMVHCSAFYA